MLLKNARKDHVSNSHQPISFPKDPLKTTMSHPTPPPHHPSTYYLLLTILLFLIPIILSTINIRFALATSQPKAPSFITNPPSPPACLTSYTPPSSSITTGFQVATSDPTPTNQGYVPRRRSQQMHHQALRTWTGTGGPPYDDPPM